MALVGIELVTHASEPDALTTRPPMKLQFTMQIAIWVTHIICINGSKTFTIVNYGPAEDGAVYSAAL